MVGKRVMPQVASVQLADELVAQLDQLASAVDRSRGWLIEQAIRRYLAEEAWQLAAIRSALDDARSGLADTVAHDEVMARLDTRLTEW